MPAPKQRLIPERPRLLVFYNHNARFARRGARRRHRRRARQHPDLARACARGRRELLDANLYAVTRLIAGRAPRASSARQYLASYTRFADRLRVELDRPPVVGDVTVDAIAPGTR